MNIPKDLLYSNDHEWLKIEGDQALIGITDFASHELGDIVYIEINDEEDYAVGEPFGSIEAVKTVSDLLMPVSGSISESNTELEETPELINQDPYGKGWIVRIQLAEDYSTDHLMNADAYADFIQG
ncbi:MAG: glycine cleavage system protein GcvH [Bacteroidales bacterium]|nr:glycine cleavage system protein GcvH [Bacteroidales bacterium]